MNNYMVIAGIFLILSELWSYQIRLT